MSRVHTLDQNSKVVLFDYFHWGTIICQTIIRPISFCYNMSDRFLGAVISSQTGCYNKSDTFYANNLLIYCAVIYQTTGNYLILPVVICQTNSVINRKGPSGPC